MLAAQNNLLALDVGGQRIGVAYASGIARLARPLKTISNDVSVWSELAALVKSEQIGTVVVGLPRNLSGEDTEQTRVARDFAVQLVQQMQVEVVLQDEALTSVKAESELKRRGKAFSKGEVDALAATYILEDYLGGQK